MTLKQKLKEFGMPRIIVIAFIALLFVGAVLEKQNIATLVSDSLVRFGQNMLLALAMLPMMICGAGLNMGLAIGIVCGVLGGLLGLQMGIAGLPGLLAAMVMAVAFGALAGFGYGKVLNTIKGSEMLIGNYLGSAVVYIMCIVWFAAPFTNPSIIWPMGGSGVRTTIPVGEYYGKILNNFLAVNIGGLKIPTGLLLFDFAVCYAVYLFTKSKMGMTLRLAGNNPRYAAMCGVDVDRARITGIMLSSAIAALGIVVYAQSYGFYQAYEGPLTMAFTPMAAILLGGATLKRARVRNVILGTAMIQTLLTIALPVCNQLIPESDLSEIFRIIISNGIILYALSQAGGEKR